MFPLRSLTSPLALAFGGLSSALLLALPAVAQTTGAEPKVERVEVTGSSIKRIAAETALPVQILTRDDIARTGVSNAEQLLKSVTATSTFGSATVAGTGPGGGQGGNNSVSTISLRGLGAARTLVLINGRRSAPANGGSAVDIATISLSATYQTVKPVFGTSRSFARNIDVDNYLDKTNATATFPANIRHNNGTVIAPPNYPNCGPYSLVSPLNPGVCRYDNAPFDALQPDSKLGSVAASGRFKLSTELEAYGDAGLTQHKTLNTVQHVLVNGAALAAGHPYIASLTNLLNTQYPQFPQLKSLIGFGWALLPPTSPYYRTA